MLGVRAEEVEHDPQEPKSTKEANSMANEAYQIAGAAAVGLFSGWSVGRVPEGYDIAMALGLGALGYLAAASLRGAYADVAIGAMNGAAGYVGSRLPAMLGAKKGIPQAERYEVSVPAYPAYPTSASVVEI